MSIAPADQTQTIKAELHGVLKSLAPGAKIDRFTIVELLGEGGMGTVYAVNDPQRPGQPLVLKVLRTDAAASAERRERFAREAKVVSGLYKRGIVWALETDPHGLPAWLLMERVTGLPLSDGRRALSLAALRKAYGDGLPEREVARLLDICLDGLHAAHAQGVVHRDLKPENILLDPGGETDPARALEKAEPKIADFGLVALRATEGELDHATTLPPPLTLRGPGTDREGALLGTWDFMAPEQRKGLPADKRSDTYAMTLVAFWLLTGQHLGVNKARELRPSLSPAWEAFLARGYAPDPANRYQDAAEMRQALQPVIRALNSAMTGQAPVTVETPRSAGRPPARPPLPRRKRGFAYGAMAVGVALVAAYGTRSCATSQKLPGNAALSTPSVPTNAPPTAQTPIAIPEAPVPRETGPKPPVAGDWVMTLDEEFDGATLDSTRWNTAAMNFWDKRSHFSKDNVTLSNGLACLRFEKKTGFHNDDPDKAPTDHATGYLDTFGKWTQRYGYFEARMKLPTAPGLAPSFWMMPDRGVAFEPQSQRANTGDGGMEFDVMEHLTRWGAHRYSIAMHWDGYGKDKKSKGFTCDNVQADKDGFITAGLLWAPGLAVYYCNGREVARWRSSRVSNVPSDLMFTHVSGGWDNNALDDAQLPADFLIDYVRCWQRKDMAAVPEELHVAGNRLVNPAGKPVWLQGLAVGSPGWTTNSDHVLESIAVGVDQWKANCIRLSVSDDFWFGRGNGQTDNGEAYRSMIDSAIEAVASRGAYVALNLHHNVSGAPTEAHAVFWKDAASRYKDHPAVLFELLNEPNGITWAVWRDGDAVPAKPKKQTSRQTPKSLATHSLGHQALVDAVRATGARNIVIAGGLEWCTDLSGVVNGYALTERTGGNGIMYAGHIYPCVTNWQARLLVAAAQHPIFISEVACNLAPPAAPVATETPHIWAPDTLGLIQRHKLNWTAWCFHTVSSPCILADWNYTPTPYWGAYVKEALAGKVFEAKGTR